jgi:uncharacterized protein YbaR (Trm112 family)
LRYFFFELLACPVCKSPDLILVELKVEESKANVDPSKVRCRERCYFLRKPAGEVPLDVCKGCVNKDVIEGVLVCRSCGRWYPIIDGIPRMLDDRFRKVKEDVQWMLSRIDRVPPEVRALMKYPELPKA